MITRSVLPVSLYKNLYLEDILRFMNYYARKIETGDKSSTSKQQQQFLHSKALGVSNGVHSQQTKCCQWDYLNMALKDRPIMSRRISLVPAPISYSLASRRNRPMG